MTLPSFTHPISLCRAGGVKVGTGVVDERSTSFLSPKQGLDGTSSRR